MVLIQKQKPIAYFIQALSTRARAKSVHERELMTFVIAIQRWRHYLLGQEFVVWTNQCSLRFLMQKMEVRSQYQRWVIKLLDYDFVIEY